MEQAHYLCVTIASASDLCLVSYVFMKIGLRREDKSIWETRTPLTPDHVRSLLNRSDLKTEVVVQPSTQRVFEVQEYVEAGAQISEDLSSCELILGVKEIPPNLLRENTSYCFFSHTIKGQEKNMGLLRRLIELNCTLLDYECIRDEDNQRLVAFGEFAGLAGMFNSFWAYHQRMEYEGRNSPFVRIQPARYYNTIDQARRTLEHIQTKLHKYMADTNKSFIIGVTGSGRVAKGALSMVKHLNPKFIKPEYLPQAHKRPGVYLVEFGLHDRVSRIEGGKVSKKEYLDNPKKYQSEFSKYLNDIDILVNCIYWEPGYPRLVTKEDLRNLQDDSSLKVIVDISCDLQGSIEATVMNTSPKMPLIVYDRTKRDVLIGVDGSGPVIMANEILPSEFPREASDRFGTALIKILPEFIRAHQTGWFEMKKLSTLLQKAIVVHGGQLTPNYSYLDAILKNAKRRPVAVQ